MSTKAHSPCNTGNGFPCSADSICGDNELDMIYSDEDELSKTLSLRDHEARSALEQMQTVCYRQFGER